MDTSRTISSPIRPNDTAISARRNTKYACEFKYVLASGTCIRNRITAASGSLTAAAVVFGDGGAVVVVGTAVVVVGAAVVVVGAAVVVVGTAVVVVGSAVVVVVGSAVVVDGVAVVVVVVVSASVVFSVRARGENISCARTKDRKNRNRMSRRMFSLLQTLSDGA